LLFCFHADTLFSFPSRRRHSGYDETFVFGAMTWFSGSDVPRSFPTVPARSPPPFFLVIRHSSWDFGKHISHLGPFLRALLTLKVHSFFVERQIRFFPPTADSAPSSSSLSEIFFLHPLCPCLFLFPPAFSALEGHSPPLLMFIPPR